MKSVLLHINQDPGQESRLAAAVEIVRANQGRLSCLQASPLDAFMFTGDPYGAVYFSSDLFETLRESEKLERVRIEALLEIEGIDWEWLHVQETAPRAIIEHAKLVDLVVLSQPEHEKTLLAPLAADVAVHVRSPTLVVPISNKSFDYGGTAMIAWNGSSESAHAVRLSLSLLRAASVVRVVQVNEDDEHGTSAAVLRYLAQHGIEAEAHQHPRGDASVGSALIEAAADLEAGYIVLGAYGHSRVRETVLGGVTQDLIFGSPVPLVLAH